MIFRRSVVVVSILLALSAAVAWAAPAAVDLAFQGHPGDVNKYVSTVDFAMDIQAAPPGSGVALTVTPTLQGNLTTLQRVKGVADNGDLTLGMQVESFDFKLDAADFHLRLGIYGPEGSAPKLIKLPPLPIETTMSKRGKLVNVIGLEKLPLPPVPGPDGKPMNLSKMIDAVLSDFSQPMFPDHPVKPGETWKWKTVVDPLATMKKLGMAPPEEAKAVMPDIKVPLVSTSTLTGFETVGGVECARIETTTPWEIEVPMGPPSPGAMTLREQGKTTLTMWFDYLAGRSVKEDVRVQYTMSLGDGHTTPVKATMRGAVVSQLSR